jgi:serine/threonine-protein kinase PpkA
MQVIPGGCFQMGSFTHERHRQHDERRHRVCVKRFEIASHEVTIAEFRRFVRATHYITDAEINFIKPGCWSYDEQKQRWGWWAWANWKQPHSGTIKDSQAVSCVNYYDIQAYIDWLNRKTGEYYRLPTEAEWEYAARAGSTGRYFWGNNPDLACRFANVDDKAKQQKLKMPNTFQHQCHDQFVYAAPVKQYLPNRHKLYDMTGNVWEWTCSEYSPEYTGQEQSCSPHPTDSVFLAVRGGGWNAGPDRSRLAYRNWQNPWVRLATWGFRLVKEKRYRRLKPLHSHKK